jgi:hypothetical protein
VQVVVKQTQAHPFLLFRTTKLLLRRTAMNLDDLIIAWFCLIDDGVPLATESQRLRKSGPEPSLADSEVMTMEVIGAYLGLDQDKALFASFQRHGSHFFPALVHLHRTTCVRQATNLWGVKERLWCAIRDTLLSSDPTIGIIDSFPLPVCQFARAYRCRRFRGEASYGKDTVIRQTFYGFRLHARICWPGVITRIELVPAHIHEGEAALDLTPGTTGLLLGDRTSWLPKLKAILRQAGILSACAFSLGQTGSTRLARVPYWDACATGLIRSSGSWSTAVTPNASGREIAGTCAIGSCAWSG